MNKAVVLMSGGLDSTTVLAYAQSQGYDVVGLSFDYGQRHKIEMISSEKIANYFRIQRKVFKIDLKQIGGSALTSEINVEKGKLDRNEIPNTYVPGRNIIFLTIAGAYADILKAETVMIGVNSVDYSGYPDCRPEFIESMEKALNLGLAGSYRCKLNLVAPLQRLGKGEIVKMGIKLKAPYSLTYSCYNGNERSCGKCDSCLLRLRGFMEANEIDPIEYSEYPDFYSEYIKSRNSTNG